MRKITTFCIAIFSLAAGSDVLSQPPYSHSIVDTDSWVALKDSRGVVRGGLRILGSGSSATVQFTDADRVPLEAPFGAIALRSTGDKGLTALALESDPPGVDEKADGPANIRLLQSQVATLQHNVKLLQDRVNGTR